MDIGVRGRSDRSSRISSAIVAIAVLTAAAMVAPSATAQIPATERQALIALYNSTNGAGWTNRTNWRNATDTDFNDIGTECTWFGIGCSAGHIAQITLADNHMVGTLPPDLGLLTLVTRLVLSRNSLGGTIPTEVGSLGELTDLYLDGNLLGGAIPSSLQNLAKLTALDVRWNLLDTVYGALRVFLLGKQIGHDLDRSQTRVPTNVGAGAGASTSAGVTWTPVAYVADSGGYEVHMATNSGGPYVLVGRTPDKLGASASFTVGGLQPLTTYYFIVRTVTDPNVHNPNVVMSDFTAEVSATTPAPPSGLERASLIALYNSTGGAGWFNRANWRNVADTDFNTPGTECTWFGVYCTDGQISGIRLPQNHLVGTIPPEVANIVALSVLDLRSNLLNGGVPPALGTMGNLRVIALWNNQLSGTIPVGLAAAPNLGTLELGWNNLSGPIPPELATLRGLYTLGLERNHLTGAIPRELGALAELRQLYLSENELSGPIPAELGRLTKLVQLDLHQNSLSGSIPRSLGALTSLDVLDLDRNALQGPVPTTLSGLASLSWLELAYNALYNLDADLEAFITPRCQSWPSTQTIAPTNASAAPISATKIAVSWTPIAYTWDPGGYEVHVAAFAGGPYALAGRTANKSVTSLVVTGLVPSMTYYFIVKTVTDPHTNNKNTVTSEPTPEFSATTAQALAITSPTTMTPALVGTTYTQWLRAMGGSGSYGPWTPIGDTLPPGLWLSVGGALTGVPTTPGDYTFTIQVTDSEGATATAALTLRVNQAPAITSPDAAIFTVGSAGSFAVTATGFPAPSLAMAGTLPGGISFNGVTGALGGTPQPGSGGMYPLNVSASNGAAGPATQALKLLVYGVTTFSGPTATGTGEASVQLAGGGVGCGFGSVGWRTMTDVPAAPPAGWEFAHGVLRFTADTCTAGATLELKVTLPSAPAAGGGWWAYGATADDAAPHWNRLPATLFGSVVTVTITDGGPGDEDGVANGVIVHRGAPAVPVDGFRGTLRRHLKAGTPVFGPPRTMP